MESLWSQIEPLLGHVTRPGRYVGNEFHAVRKSWSDTEVHMVLAFPDAYEIGMSHLGLEILYHILNQLDWAACERVYSVWPDMENRMRDKGIPLFSLESKTPVRLFDILGISLQYELQYTNVLNLIDLSGIPLQAADRRERDPLVIAGGPCAFNPEPLADFLDAVVLGDGEEVVVEIAELARRRKQQRWSRKETLLALSKLEGVYVPCLYCTDEDSPNKAPVPIQQGVPARIQARTIPRLKPENYPESPLVPLIQVTHDRLSLEIMRGCSRNCRFCSAGMVYRPVRTRSVDDLIRQADKAVASTGYEEISLLSLSTSDYPDLPDLLRRLQDRFSDKGISISFPSLRPDTFTPEMADLSSGLRKSGLTLAPEAGTQRLRDVINKNNTETDLLKAVQTAFERGWKRIKLYFMIGLPTETEEDLEGIVSLVGKLVACSRQFGRREISLSLSPFSPKPHTPFQWEAQDPVPVLEEKIGFLKKRIRWPEVQLHWRDPRVSRLETALGRGDRTLGKALRIAWEKGARFDAWSDQLDMSKWETAFRDAGTKTEVFTSFMRPMDPLPWGHLSKGVPDAFLLRERDKAVRMEPTPDCRTVSCAGCGLESHPVCLPRKGAGHPVSASETGASVKKTRRIFSAPVVFRVRCEYAKGPEARFCSHLDTVRMFIRSLRRANVAVAYSKGFHAHPLLSFGPPLPLGFTSRFEYVDIDFLEHVPNQFDALLNRHLPSGFEVKHTALIPARTPSLDSSINLAHYRVDAEGGFDQAGILGAADRFLKLNSYKVKRGEKEVDIRLQVDRIAWKSGGLDLALRIGSGGSARPDELVQALLPKDEDPPGLIRYERTHLFVEKQGLRKTPMEIIENA